MQADVTRVSPPAVASRAGKIGLRSNLCRSRVDYRVPRSWVDHARIDFAGFSAMDHAHRSRRGRLAAADFRLSDVGALRRRPATTPSPRRPCPEHDSGSVQGVPSGDRQDGHRGSWPRSLGRCVRTRQSANASASVPEHDAADSPLTIGQPDCPHDCYPAIGSPQAGVRTGSTRAEGRVCHASVRGTRTAACDVRRSPADRNLSTADDGMPCASTRLARKM